MVVQSVGELNSYEATYIKPQRIRHGRVLKGIQSLLLPDAGLPGLHSSHGELQVLIALREVHSYMLISAGVVFNPGLRGRGCLSMSHTRSESTGCTLLLVERDKKQTEPLFPHIPPPKKKTKTTFASSLMCFISNYVRWH